MTAPTTVARTFEHVVVAECSTCRLHVQMLPQRDLHRCLQSFRAAHPMTGTLPHERLVPDGWSLPLSGPGALSQ